MNINLHIEQLVFDGLPVTSAQGATMRAAIEGELTRLLTERGIESLSGGAVPQLPVASIHFSPGGQPAQWGRQIARTLYDGLAPAPRVTAHGLQPDRASATPVPRVHSFQQRSVNQNH